MALLLATLRHDVDQQLARCHFGALVGQAVLRGPQAVAVFEQARQLWLEAFTVALFHGCTEVCLPVGPVGDPLAILFTQAL
ncbi:hypothetical protein D3C75_1312060 [compost metagenome]